MAKKVTYNEVQVAVLAEAFGKSTQTIRRWITQNDDRLTSDRAKEALVKYSSLMQ